MVEAGGLAGVLVWAKDFQCWGIPAEDGHCFVALHESVKTSIKEASAKPLSLSKPEELSIMPVHSQTRAQSPNAEAHGTWKLLAGCLGCLGSLG